MALRFTNLNKIARVVSNTLVLLEHNKANTMHLAQFKKLKASTIAVWQGCVQTPKLQAPCLVCGRTARRATAPIKNVYRTYHPKGKTIVVRMPGCACLAAKVIPDSRFLRPMYFGVIQL